MIDEENKKVVLDLSGEDTVIQFIEREEKLTEEKIAHLEHSESLQKDGSQGSNTNNSTFKNEESEFIVQFEYGRWMIESKFSNSQFLKKLIQKI